MPCCNIRRRGVLNCSAHQVHRERLRYLLELPRTLGKMGKIYNSTGLRRLKNRYVAQNLPPLPSLLCLLCLLCLYHSNLKVTGALNKILNTLNRLKMFSPHLNPHHNLNAVGYD
jgi:hypothetical protein